MEMQNEKFENEYLKDNKYRKFGDHCHYTGEYNTTQITSCWYYITWSLSQISHCCTNKKGMETQGFNCS